jgi:transcriptional regulator with XRE-family HTH domain
VSQFPQPGDDDKARPNNCQYNVQTFMFASQTCGFHKHVCAIDIIIRFRNIHSVRPPHQNKADAPFATGQFYKEVGLRIRQARKKADNLTQEALAVSVGLTRTSLTNIEKGRQKVLLHTFTEIASALGIDPLDLLPKKETLLNGLGVNLPSSLAPDERGFIERALGAGEPYENQQTKNHRTESKRAASKKRDNESAD